MEMLGLKSEGVASPHYKDNLQSPGLALNMSTRTLRDSFSNTTLFKHTVMLWTNNLTLHLRNC